MCLVVHSAVDELVVDEADELSSVDVGAGAGGGGGVAGGVDEATVLLDAGGVATAGVEESVVSGVEVGAGVSEGTGVTGAGVGLGADAGADAGVDEPPLLVPLSFIIAPNW